jgi:hypothetical protein
MDDNQLKFNNFGNPTGHLGTDMRNANYDPHDPSIGSDTGTDSLTL